MSLLHVTSKKPTNETDDEEDVVFSFHSLPFPPPSGKEKVEEKKKMKGPFLRFYI